jgi:UrcA family protein
MLANLLFFLTTARRAVLACNLVTDEASLICPPPSHEDASMNTSRKWISALAAATVVSLFAVPASAADVGDATGLSKTVKMWDLDLAKSEDVQALYARVRDAASDVCRAETRRYRSGTRRPAPLGWSERCVADAVDAAVRDVGSRRLATLHSNGARAML